jgi:hypothetical protein
MSIAKSNPADKHFAASSGNTEQSWKRQSRIYSANLHGVVEETIAGDPMSQLKWDQHLPERAKELRDLFAVVCGFLAGLATAARLAVHSIVISF